MVGKDAMEDSSSASRCEELLTRRSSTAPGRRVMPSYWTESVPCNDSLSSVERPSQASRVDRFR